MEVYLQPIQNIQPSPLIDALLKDILDIQQPHNILLNDLMASTGCKENFPNEKLDTAPIGKIFSDISPYLKIYLKYMSNHSQVGAFLAHASKKLSNYLNECINKPECQQRDFDVYNSSFRSDPASPIRQCLSSRFQDTRCSSSVSLRILQRPILISPIYKYISSLL